MKTRRRGQFGIGGLGMTGLTTLITLALGSCIGGCESPQDTETVLRMLQEGKARGHLTITTDARLGVGTNNGVWIGASGTTFAFDGDINYSDAELVGPPAPTALTVPTRPIPGS